MGVTLSTVSDKDIEELVHNIRSVDKREIQVMCQADHEYAIRFSVEASQDRCLSVRDSDDGDLICIFGVSSLTVLGLVGAPWLIGTPKMNTHARDLMEVSRVYLQCMLDEFDMLTNIVWAGNKASIRYLKKLGFDFSELKTNVRTTATYYTFSKRT